MNMESEKGNILIAESGRIIDLIDYQSGAVVSRTIIERNAGTVTLFAFDKGQGLSEHTAPFDAIVFVFEGEAEITISGRKNLVRANQIMIMPANEPHTVHALKRFKMVLTLIRS